MRGGTVCSDLGFDRLQFCADAEWGDVAETEVLEAESILISHHWKSNDEFSFPPPPFTLSLLPSISSFSSF